MLTGLHLGNFKAFAETQRVPIRPLTLIFGANSAGKSSIIHALALARHALETGELDVHRTTVGGEAIDLGGFRQYVHHHDQSLHMEWAAELDTASFTGRFAHLLAPAARLTVSTEIGLPQSEEMQERDSVDARTGKSIRIKVPTGKLIPAGDPEVLSYSIAADGQTLLQMSKRPDGKLQLDHLDYEHPVFREVLNALVVTSTTTESLRPEDYEGLAGAVHGLVPEIAASAGRFLPSGLAPSETFTPGTQSTLFPISQGRRQEDLATAIRSFLPRKLDDLLRGTRESLAGELMRLRYLGPVRSYPPRHLAFSQHHDPNWHAGGGYAWDVVRRDARVRALVNEWLNSSDRLQTPYELRIRALVGIDGLEVPLLEGLEGLSGGGLDVEYEPDSEHTVGGAIPFIKDVEAEAARLRDLIRASDMEKLNELVLVDRRSNTVVSHRDVGIGISQVLPVLVSAYAVRGRLLAIEQPEIHLHPALQADLGDVFIQSALGEARNRCIIETHSEHLLLRVMRRMRETAQGRREGGPEVTPPDVALLFVQRENGRAVVLELRLDEEGALLDPWPGGFFEEGFRERFA
jgi:hypothetical protein